MRRFKHILLVILCIAVLTMCSTLLVTFSAPSLAEGESQDEITNPQESTEPTDPTTPAETDTPPDDTQVTDAPPEDGADALTELLTQIVDTINTQQEKIFDLEMQLELLKVALGNNEVDTQILAIQSKQSQNSVKYLFTSESNNVRSLIINGRLMEHKIALLDKQIAVEKVKLSLGESSQMSVDALETQASSARLQFSANKDIVVAKRGYLKTKADAVGYETVMDYSVPEKVDTFYEKSAEELKSALLDNNVNLKMYKRQLEKLDENFKDMYDNPAGVSDETLEATNAQIDQMSAQVSMYEEQLAWTAINKYAEYEAACAQYESAISSRPLLNAQLVLIDTAYASGEISEIACLEQKYSIYEELSKADSAVVNLLNVIAQLEMMENGVVG
jgi:conjugal transfer/entry exclusion protein